MAEKTGCLEQIRQFGPIRIMRGVGLTINAAGEAVAEKIDHPMSSDVALIELFKIAAILPFALVAMVGQLIAIAGFAEETELNKAGWGTFPWEK